MKLTFLKTTLLSAFALAGMATGSVSAQTVNYEIEPTHTFVTFEVKHFNTSTLRGRFDHIEGNITLDRKAASGSADITIDMASINSGVKDFDQHLKSADFFNVDSSAQAKFTGTDFTFDGEKLTAVSGQLALLGKALPVTLTATGFNCYDQPVLKVHICGGDFETTIKRSEWGMDWGLDMGVPDDVRLLIQIEAIQK